jgi:serine/threonine protein kinase/tetratricopeptide (TPR) repeat protein
MPLASGAHLGSYEILGLIGSGGMGEVYKARDPRLQRDVALKVLPPDFAGDPDRLARFEREARTVAALSNPNIVTIHSIEDADGVRFLTMEYVSGRPLMDLIGARGMPIARILELAIPVADALAAAHGRGIVHRDLKPANVMVDDEGRVKVLDFGLAKPHTPAIGGTEGPTETVTVEGRIVGTVPYMAPEQLRGERVDARADLFSLGAMLYEMASGVRPFRGHSTLDVVSAILREEPAPLQQVRPDLPLRFVQLVTRCLEKDPQRRAQSAVDLRQELRGLAEELRSSGARAVATGSSEAAAVSTSRARPSWLPWAVGLAAVLGIAVITTLILWRPRPDGGAGGAPAIKSLAVLPFANLTRDASQDFFVEGMHEALITDLAKLGTLRVTSRNSVLRYKNQAVSIKDVAKELGVDAIIEGSVLRAGDKVRITAQLIHGTTDEHVWAESYDRDLRDVLSLLSEVSRAIAGEVRAKLGGAPVSPAAAPVRAPVEPKAWEAYLRGRHAFNYGLTSQTSTRYLVESVGEAAKRFEEAVALDPRFAEAWSGLAFTKTSQAFFGTVPVAEAIPAARQAARQALDLDPTQGEAYGALGVIHLVFDWDFEQARRDLEQAITLNPYDIYIRHGYADYLSSAGRTQEALAQMRIARGHNPNMPWSQVLVMTHLSYASRDYDEVLAEARRTRTAYPTIDLSSTIIADCLWRLGRYEESIAETRTIDPDAAAILSDGLRRGGPRAAKKAYADSRAAKATPQSNHISIAELYADAGEPDLAFAWLEKAVARRQPQIYYLPGLPALDGLRDDPRYRDLVRRIGLPVAASLPR